MYAINTGQSLIMNFYFFTGLHTALHVKVTPCNGYMCALELMGSLFLLC